MKEPYKLESKNKGEIAIMVNAKKELTGADFKIEEIKKKISQKDKDIKLANERMQKEMELVEFHKNKLKKYTDDLKKINLEKKGLRMDLMDLRADMAKIDRDEYFENVMTAVDNKTSKSVSNEKIETPVIAQDEKQNSPNKENTESQIKDNMTPLDKARAEFNKKHPNGFSVVERSK